MHKPLVAALLLVGLAGPPLAWGGPTADVRPSTLVVLSGASHTVAVGIDCGAGCNLGSYGATLAWDPAVLAFAGYAGGTPPFDDPVVNADDVDLGLLRFADAAAPGASGRVVVIEVTFTALESPPATTALDLALTSLFAAGSYDDLLAVSTVRDGQAYIADYAFGLRVGPAGATLLDWSVIPVAVSYDAIRGDLATLRAGPAGQLGAVLCFEAGSLDTTTGAGTEPAHPDTEVPAPGAGFFYLVRFDDGVASRTYGYVVPLGVEREASAGDCPAR